MNIFGDIEGDKRLMQIIDDLPVPAKLPGKKELEENNSEIIRALKEATSQAKAIGAKYTLPKDNGTIFLLAQTINGVERITGNIKLSENDRMYLAAYLKEILPADISPELIKVLKPAMWKALLTGAALQDWIRDQDCNNCVCDECDDGDDEDD